LAVAEEIQSIWPPEAVRRPICGGVLSGEIADKKSGGKIDFDNPFAE
jgi:hypothetical protein